MRRFLLAVVATLILGDVAALAAVQPNDPAWHEQWAQRQIRLPDAWEITTGDPGIVIALIDTGVNPIPDLEGALVPGWDFVENDAEPQDTQSHGTRVASVIAARGNNGIGMAGHCWRCSIMPVRVSAGGAVSADRLAAGIRFAVQRGARIINVSLTRPGLPDAVEEQAIRYAIDSGVLVVASAGNAGTEAPQYPAAYPGVLSVGGTDDSDTLYFWSSRGPWVGLTAPGCHMVLDATIPPGTICGTSFTPAAVSGVAGLILSRNPSLTSYQVAGALAATARPVPGVAWGRLDAYAAFQWLGLVPAVPSAPAQTSAPAAPAARTVSAPGQRFSRQTRFETGTFKKAFRSTFRVGRGRFETQLVTPRARECSLSLRTPQELILALPAVKNILSLSVQVAAGRYTLDIRCEGAGARNRQFSLGVIANFPRGAP
ncbi:MAG: S8 family serine peptidase [Actinobacteria bacterium]|nr:S8 family serine peptidase [Actinomycetota bacterium]